LPGPRGTDRYYQLRAKPAWRQFAGAQTAIFSRFRHQYAEHFSRWARRAFGDAETPRALFHPFYGPDCAFLLLLQPEAEVYVLDRYLAYSDDNLH
jgi:hypothetical protein